MSQLGSIRIGSPAPQRRGVSVRAKIVALLLAPLLPLVTMTVFAVAIAMSPAQNLANTKTSVEAAGIPTVFVLRALEAERALSVRFVGTAAHEPSDTEAIVSARATTDGLISDLLKSTSTKAFQSAATAQTKSLLGKFTGELADIAAGRKAVDDGETRAAVMTFYNGIADDLLFVYRSIASLDDHVLSNRAGLVVSMAAAGEMFSREDALIAGIAAAGVMTTRDYTDIVGTIAKQREMYAQIASGLRGPDLADYKRVTSTDAARRLHSAEDALVANPNIGGRPKLDYAKFQTDFDTVFRDVQGANDQMTTRVIKATGAAAASRKGQLVAVIVICGLMLLGLIGFSWYTMRNLMRRVAQLRAEALTLAMDRLPSVVERLRAGQSVDVEAEVPPLTVGVDELGQLSEAFTRVQHTAIASAVHEATLRQGFNQVFLNIARRSQTLLHRQLALLDAMERRATDPEDLEELFRVDHLATRMRRHAEDLVILAGSTPGRGWRVPVPIADVLRAAASEVEEYARINVAVPPSLSLIGRAVNDVVHLLAELLENATSFSPPGSPVTLNAYVVPNGLAIEVEDRGLGMTAEAIEEANQRLAVPPDFDPAHSSRLGLFVVAKLAARQNIRVSLRRSAYGGLAAVTLVPNDLVVAPSAPQQLEAIDGMVISAALDDRPAPASRVMALAGTATPGTLDGLPQRSAEASRSEKPERPSRNGNRTADGLPIRIRQASVARTLPGTVEDTTEVAPVATARTPEQMRNMLSSYQDGMNQGRAAAAATSEADIPLAGAPAFGTARGDEHQQPERSTSRGTQRAGTENGAAPVVSTDDDSTTMNVRSPMLGGGSNDDN